MNIREVDNTEQGHWEAGELLACCLLPSRAAVPCGAAPSSNCAVGHLPACRSCRVMRGFESGKQNDGRSIGAAEE